MNTFEWLLKREYWEHKGAFLWAPVVVGLIMAAFVLVSLIIALSGLSSGMQINGIDVTNLASVITPEQKAAFAAKFAFGYAGISMPIFIALGFCVFFFCLGTLYDERRDRSVLFWKSLPLSDHATVLSKVVMAIGIAPAIAIVVGCITSVFIGFLICLAAAVAGINVFGEVLSTPATYLAPLQIAAMLPIYALWALPAIGWLIMVSAWARSRPLLWAIGVPVMTGILLSWAQRMFSIDWNSAWYWKNVVGRLLASVLPGSWLSERSAAAGIEGPLTALSGVLNQSWQLLAHANIWIGAVAGVAMIYAAIRLRGWRDEG